MSALGRSSSSPARSCSSSSPAVVGVVHARATEIYFRNALVAVAVVVAIYVFVGNSGVLSFGQISFAAVGAFAAGVMTVPADVKPACCRAFAFIRDTPRQHPVARARRAAGCVRAARRRCR